MTSRRFLLAALGAIALRVVLALVASMAAAQDLLAKPIKFVRPFPLGTDISARRFGKKLSEFTGKSMVVDNKPGVNGFTAVRAVLADDYTVFVGSRSMRAGNVALFKALSYDPMANFAPLIMMMRSPALIVVPGNSEHKTREFYERIGAQVMPGGAREMRNYQTSETQLSKRIAVKAGFEQQ